MGRDMECVGSTTNRYELHLGDCMDVLKAIAGESVDSIVCDPPYHLTQASRGGHARTNNPEMPHGRHRIGDKGFMGKVWDGGDIAHRVELWAECLRVLKPGGHLLAFAGSRTYHRMTVAIEDAGFEIRDQIMWIYGSGFPKSKNLDGDWEGWGSALKPSHEPICMARKPLIGTVAANVDAHGTGAININGCRIPSGDDHAEKCASVVGLASNRTGNAYGEWTGARIDSYSPLGRWPANVIHDGSDEVVGSFPLTRNGGQNDTSSKGDGMFMSGSINKGATSFAGDAGSAARFFYCAKASRVDRNEGIGGSDTPAVGTEATMRDRETADWQDRNGNHHPTVKPTDLMAYLCRLVTPPNGLVLDPFMGSGSTGKAAIREGFRFIGIDMTPEYVEIAKARIQFEADRVEQERVDASRQSDMFAEVA